MVTIENLRFLDSEEPSGYLTLGKIKMDPVLYSDHPNKMIQGYARLLMCSNSDEELEESDLYKRLKTLTDCVRKYPERMKVIYKYPDFKQMLRAGYDYEGGVFIDSGRGKFNLDDRDINGYYKFGYAEMDIWDCIFCTIGTGSHSWGDDWQVRFNYLRAKMNDYEYYNFPKSPRKSCWLHEEGDKVEINVTITDQKFFESSYGPSSIISMFDKDHNEYKWFTAKALEFEDGKPIFAKVKGTVKKNETYIGNKQTILTRCKIEPIEK